MGFFGKVFFLAQIFLYVLRWVLISKTPPIRLTRAGSNILDMFSPILIKMSWNFFGRIFCGIWNNWCDFLGDRPFSGNQEKKLRKIVAFCSFCKNDQIFTNIRTFKTRFFLTKHHKQVLNTPLKRISNNFGMKFVYLYIIFVFLWHLWKKHFL